MSFWAGVGATLIAFGLVKLIISLVGMKKNK